RKGGESMARQLKTIRNQIVKNMRNLGVYKKEYKTTIDVFADMVHQYEVFTEEFEKQGHRVQEEYTNKAGATNMRKTPIYSAMEKLRMDISTYSNLLCLNPKALENIKPRETGESKLAEVLSKLE
ncbi:MAG TPA: P27 family phage terminase small subunit, partial [Thermoclostridium sp.]|nr:P27 family phage terminase small subunit [Thermoclostridium sp.]